MLYSMYSLQSEYGQPRAQRGGVVVHDDHAQHGAAAAGVNQAASELVVGCVANF